MVTSDKNGLNIFEDDAVLSSPLDRVIKLRKIMSEKALHGETPSSVLVQIEDDLPTAGPFNDWTAWDQWTDWGNAI